MFTFYSASSRYALVDFGLAQGTPDTQIELLKVVNSKSQKGARTTGHCDHLKGKKMSSSVPAKTPNISATSQKFNFPSGTKSQAGKKTCTTPSSADAKPNKVLRPGSFYVKIWRLHVVFFIL